MLLRSAVTLLAVSIAAAAAPAAAIGDVEPQNDSPISAEPIPGITITGSVNANDTDYYALKSARNVEVNITTTPSCVDTAMTDTLLQPIRTHGPTINVRYLEVRAASWHTGCKNIGPTAYTVTIDATQMTPPYAPDPTALSGTTSGLPAAVNVDRQANDTQATAVPITSGPYYEGISSPGDDDWMTFIAAGGPIRWAITQLTTATCGRPAVGAPFVYAVTLNPARSPALNGYEVWTPLGEAEFIPDTLSQSFDAGTRGFVRMTSSRPGCRWLLHVITPLAPETTAALPAAGPASTPTGPVAPPSTGSSRADDPAAPPAAPAGGPSPSSTGSPGRAAACARARAHRRAQQRRLAKARRLLRSASRSRRPARKRAVLAAQRAVTAARAREKSRCRTIAR